jgi:hypothetical protein
MAEFNVKKNEEYCNLNPTLVLNIFEEDTRVYIDETTKTKEPYFDCLKTNTENTKTDARYCGEDLY